MAWCRQTSFTFYGLWLLRHLQCGCSLRDQNFKWQSTWLLDWILQNELLLAHNLAAFLHLLVECLLRAFQLSENTHTQRHTNCVESPGCFPQSHCFWDYVAYHKCAQTSNCKWEFSVVYYRQLMLQSDAPVDRFTDACNWTLAFMSYLYFTPMTATHTEENHYFKAEWKREKILKWLI